MCRWHVAKFITLLMHLLPPVLTIDGPSGAGKGTISQYVAQHLGWHYLDSGAIYRALAVAADAQAIHHTAISALLNCIQQMQLQFVPEKSALRVWLNGADITESLRLESTGNQASTLAVIPEVRAALLERQRDFRQMPGLVADGRDMGTVVFPDAPYKVFLTASAEERAQRRYKQLNEQGVCVKLASLVRDISARDQRDMQRANAPLKAAADAYTIDTTGMPIEKVVAAVLALLNAPAF